MSRPVLLFAHGSGAGHDHPWMQAWTAQLASLGRVERLTYGYRAAGRRFPTPVPTLVAEHLAAAQALDGSPVVLIGKSLGARVGCIVAAHLASQGRPPAAVVCLGYPLLSRAKTPTVRDGPLRALPVPALLVQGDRDPLSPLAQLREVLMTCPLGHAVHVVPDGDHSLQSRKRPLARAGRTQQDLDGACVAAIRGYLAERGVDGNTPPTGGLHSPKSPTDD